MELEEDDPGEDDGLREPSPRQPRSRHESKAVLASENPFTVDGRRDGVNAPDPAIRHTLPAALRASAIGAAATLKKIPRLCAECVQAGCYPFAILRPEQ